MTSISDRLKKLGVSVGSQNIPPSKAPSAEPFPIEKVLSGEIWTTPHGEVFVVETDYKGDFLRGSIKLKPSSSLDLIGAYVKAPDITHLDIEKFAFMDTETTGLGTGTGVLPFMVGIGRFEGDQFKLAQFFLREPGEEAAQLAAIEPFLAPCEAWVSFNGKSFDLPLLNNRFILNGWPIPLEDAPHIDLLHLARRLWRTRLPSRALGDLEAMILGTTRSQQDVPGWMIPDLYNDYLHSRDARPMLGIFYHNEMDVVSLAALLAHMADLLANPLGGEVQYGLDMIAIGKLYADLGYLEQAAQIYLQGLTYDDLQEEAYWQALRELSFIQKKQLDFNAACQLWEEAAQQGQIYAYIELAKECEHRRKDLSTALNLTATAIEIISREDFPSYERVRLLPELEHRQARLERRLANDR